MPIMNMLNSRSVRFLVKSRTGTHIAFWGAVAAIVLWFVCVYACTRAVFTTYDVHFGTTLPCIKDPDPRECSAKHYAIGISLLSPVALVIMFGVLYGVYCYICAVRDDIRRDIATWDIETNEAAAKKG